MGAESRIKPPKWLYFTKSIQFTTNQWDLQEERSNSRKEKHEYPEGCKDTGHEVLAAVIRKAPQRKTGGQVFGRVTGSPKRKCKSGIAF